MTDVVDKLVVVILVVIILRDFDTMLDFGVGAVVLLFATTLLLTAVGHMLDGPDHASRIELGLFTSQRSGAVALLIATEAMPGAAPAVVAYGVAALDIREHYEQLQLDRRATGLGRAATTGKVTLTNPKTARCETAFDRHLGEVACAQTRAALPSKRS